MGQSQSGAGGPPGEGGEKKKEEKKKYEPPPPPTGGKKKKKKGPQSDNRLPAVTPNTKCRLRLLKLERIKDYLLMEEEFIQNQERLKPQVSALPPAVPFSLTRPRHGDSGRTAGCTLVGTVAPSPSLRCPVASAARLASGIEARPVGAWEEMRVVLRGYRLCKAAGRARAWK